MRRRLVEHVVAVATGAVTQVLQLLATRVSQADRERQMPVAVAVE
jgi:hypothetical protein